MRLELDQDEADDLREAVNAALKGLAHELVDTDQREYRDFLRSKLVRFERLSAEIERAAAPQSEERPAFR
jgi:hypothetical protein